MSQSKQKPQIPMAKLWAALLLAILAILAIGDYERWVLSGFTGHTLWDWLTIFLLPTVLVLLIWLTIVYPKSGKRQSQLKPSKQHKRIIWILVIAAVIVAFIILVVGGYAGWTWTGFSEDKLWDWLQFLILPAVLPIAPMWYNLRLHQGKKLSPEWRIFWLAQLAIFLAAFVIVIIGSFVWGWTWTGFRGKSVLNSITQLALPIGVMFATIWIYKLQDQLPNPAPKSSKPAPQARVPSSILLLFVETIILIGIGGFLAFFLSFSAQPGKATSASANGMMLGYNAQHTHLDPNEKFISPAALSRLQFAWKVSTGGEIWSAATVANGIVYISANGNPNGDSNGIKNIGNFYAFDATTGHFKWKLEIGSYDFGNAPTVANGVVYMGAPDDYLYALNANNGNILWRGLTGGRIGSSPTLVGDMIYIGSDDGNLYAFKTGGCGKAFCKPVWHHYIGKDIRSSPAVYNNVVYIGSSDHNLYAINASIGKKLWQFQTGNGISSSPAVYDNIVYVGSDDGKLYAINTDGTLAWESQKVGGIDSSPAVYNGVVYVGSDDGNLYAFNAAYGNLLGTATTGGSISSSPTIIASGVLFIGSDDGNLYAFDITGCGSASCQPLYRWSYSTAGSVVSSPVVANGYVYVGSNDGNLYAFDLSGA